MKKDDRHQQLVYYQVRRTFCCTLRVLTGRRWFMHNRRELVLSLSPIPIRYLQASRKCVFLSRLPESWLIVALLDAGYHDRFEFKNSCHRYVSLIDYAILDSRQRELTGGYEFLMQNCKRFCIFLNATSHWTLIRRCWWQNLFVRYCALSLLRSVTFLID